MNKLLPPLILALAAPFASAQLVINEILFDPAFSGEDPSVGDSNGDGSRSATEDEFVELVNISGGSLDLTNWTISDNSGVTHTFASTTLAAGQAIVVFGGGNPTGSFGGSLTAVASGGTLGLANGGDEVLVSDANGVQIALYAYASGDASDESLVLATELDGTSGYIPHSTASGASGAYSPGTQVSEAPFGGDSLQVSITPEFFLEGAGAAAASGTVTRTGDLTSALTVTLQSSDVTEATVPASVTISAGVDSANFDVDAVDDADQDGNQAVTISASGDNIFSGSTLITVEDDEAAIPTITVSADPTSIPENGGISTVIIEVSAADPAGYTFNLSSDDTTELSVPFMVTIAPNQTVATFTATAVDDADSDGTQSATITVSDAEAIVPEETVTITLTDDEGFSAPAIVINELRIDDPGIDDDEYIELYSPIADVSLDRISIVVIGDGSVGDGAVDDAYDLTGQSFNGNYFVAASDTFSLSDPDMRLGSNIFENSDNVTFLLVVDFTGAVGDDLDDNDDGVLNDILPWTEIIDGIGLLEETEVPPVATEYSYAEALSLQAIGPDGIFVPGHIFRSPNGIGEFVIGPFQNLDADPDADPPLEAVFALDTPGAENSDEIQGPVVTDPVIRSILADRDSGAVELVVVDLGTRIFNVEVSNDLTEAMPWVVISGTVTESDNPDGSISLSFIDNAVTSVEKRFYRLKQAQ